MTPDEAKALFAKKPPREIRVEVRVMVRERVETPAGGVEWSAFRHHSSQIVADAAIKVERISGNNGEGVTVTIGGTPEEGFEGMIPQGRPS